MLIKFNVSWTGCLDGIHPSRFEAGQEAEIPERIAAVLLTDGRASLPTAAKAIPGAPENKMIDGAAENKAKLPKGTKSQGRTR